MSQHSFHIDNLAGAAFRAALNAALEALATQSAGETAPATTYPFQVWADTAAGLIRQRNAANDGWVTLGTLGAPFFGLLPADIGPGTFLRRNAANTAYEALTLSDLLDLTGVPIGGEIFGGSEPGSGEPPQSHYICLTAGLTGAGQYNEGKLRSESVTGSAPLITATAIIDDPDSPLYGETVHLINTERRFLRAGSPGLLQDDAMQRITGAIGESAGDVPFYAGSMQRSVDKEFQGGALKRTALAGGSGRGQASGSNAVSLHGIEFDSAASPGARTDVETRPRNIGVAVYRRIK